MDWMVDLTGKFEFTFGMSPDNLSLEFFFGQVLPAGYFGYKLSEETR